MSTNPSILVISMKDDLFGICTVPRKNNQLRFCTGVRIDLAQWIIRRQLHLLYWHLLIRYYVIFWHCYSVVQFGFIVVFRHILFSLVFLYLLCKHTFYKWHQELEGWGITAYNWEKLSYFNMIFIAFIWQNFSKCGRKFVLKNPLKYQMDEISEKNLFFTVKL